MRNNRTYIIFTLMALVILFAGTAFAGSPAGKTKQSNSQYESIEGVLSIKEGHGEFLVRLPDGKSQRFSVNVGGSSEITRNGKTARYSELKPSDSIQVQYESSTRKVIAIHAMGS